MVRVPLKISPSWLQEAFVHTLASALGEDNFRFVGGCVRDSLLGRAIKDIDAATKLLPDEVMRKLQASGISTIPTGLKHGTVTALIGRESIEITTLRRDEETDGRHAVVAFSDSWREDASRRDFTMNALYMDVKGRLYDPFGGVADALAGKIRFIGHAKERIEEDALRILRFFRFCATHGQEKPDALSLNACTQSIALLVGLSAERVRGELLKICAVPDVRAILSVMQQSSVFEVLSLPLSFDAVRSLQEAEIKLKAQALAYVRLFIYANGVIAAHDFAKKFRLSNKMAQLLDSLEKIQGEPLPETIKDVRRLIYLFGREGAEQAAIVGGWPNAFLEESRQWHVPSMPVKGKDLLALGFSAGPQLGERLKKLESLWIESDFTASAEFLLAYER